MVFGIGYGIGCKYQPIWVLVSVLDRNQNSGLGLTLQQKILTTSKFKGRLEKILDGKFFSQKKFYKEDCRVFYIIMSMQLAIGGWIRGFISS